MSGQMRFLLFLIPPLLLSGCGMFRPVEKVSDSAAYATQDLIRPAATEEERRARMQDRVAQASAEEEIEDPSKGIVATQADGVKKTVQKWTGTDKAPEQAKLAYRDGDVLFREATTAEGADRTKKFIAAAAKFKTAGTRWPESALEQDALFMQGESYYFADRYIDANYAYEMLLKKYPRTRHLDTVDVRRFALARYWLELNDKDPVTINFLDEKRPALDTFGNAIRVFDKIRIDDPTGRLADDATLAAGNAFFAAGDFRRADEFYGDLRRTFPNSEHQFLAHFLSVKAKLEIYQGPEYVGEVLDEAEELVKKIRRQFPAEAEKEREFLARAYSEIRFNKAQREWNMGQYFEKRLEHGAARMYYDEVVKEYGDTPFADRAQQRLAAIEGKPDVPPQRLKWLVDMFPETSESKPLIAPDSLPGP